MKRHEKRMTWKKTQNPNKLCWFVSCDNIKINGKYSKCVAHLQMIEKMKERKKLLDFVQQCEL